MDFYEISLDDNHVFASDDQNDWSTACVTLENTLNILGIEFEYDSNGDFEFMDGEYSWSRYSRYTTKKD